MSDRIAFLDRSSKGNNWLNQILALLVLVGGGAACLLASYRSLEQWQAAEFRPVDATVIRSVAVTVGTGKRSRTYLDIAYQYTVGTATMSSDRYDLLGKQEGSLRVDRLLQRFPAGASTTAYYDPANVARAVLEPRFLVEHEPLLALGLLLSAAAFMYAVDVVLSICGAFRSWPHGGVPMRVHGAVIRVHLPPNSPRRFASWVVISYLAGLTVLGLAVQVIGIWGVPIWALLVALAPTPLVAGLAAVVRLNQIRAGRFDLVIDAQRQTLAISRGSELSELPLDQIEAIETRDVLGRTRGGTQFRTGTSVNVHTRGGKGVEIVGWPEEERADNFAKWLSSVLNRVAPGAGSGL